MPSELSSEYGISKSIINGWIKNLSTVVIVEGEALNMKEYKALKQKRARIK